MSGTVDMPRVAVAICTFNRPAGLRSLLDALEHQRLRLLSDHQVSIVVVDNSTQASARDVCDAHRQKSRFSLMFVHERRKGLAFARNAALEAAQQLPASHLAFIDDDELPGPGWLADLVEALERTGVSAAIGPVHPIFSVPPPAWLPVAAYSTRTKVTDGWAHEGYTCNCVVRVSAVKAHELRFDLLFNETGGEDTLFFRRLQETGSKIAWVEEAAVHEYVPPQRMSAAWLWRRWYRTGTTEAHLGPYGAATTAGKAVNLARGLARLIVGSGRILAATCLYAWRSPARVVASFYTACRGAGLIANVLGRDYREYSRPSYR